MSVYMNTEIFINKAIQKHGNKYDYSLVVFEKSSAKVKIICKKHGEFEQIANNHLRGRGCMLCRNESISVNKTKTTEQFIKEAIKIHGDKYLYNNIKYVGDAIKVKIICKLHGIFLQRPNSHLNGGGCPICAQIQRIDKLKHNIQDIIKEANKTHSNIYDYSKAIYINYHTKIEIICNIHGPFWQAPADHISGQGCPKCGLIKLSDCFSSNTEEFIKKAKNIYGEKYDYSLVNYINSHIKVKVICKTHGVFEIEPNNHLFGRECRKCSANISKVCKTWIGSFNNPNIIPEEKIYLKNGKYYRVDGFDPISNTIFEFNGDFWHGNPNVYNPSQLNKKLGITFGELYFETIEKQTRLMIAGYNVISIWESDFKKSLK